MDVYRYTLSYMHPYKLRSVRTCTSVCRRVLYVHLRKIFLYRRSRWVSFLPSDVASCGHDASRTRALPPSPLAFSMGTIDGGLQPTQRESRVLSGSSALSSRDMSKLRGKIFKSKTSHTLRNRRLVFSFLTLFLFLCVSFFCFFFFRRRMQKGSGVLRRLSGAKNRC